MIPKIIHYVWLGGDMPLLQKACIETWPIHCPDYEIRLWNESNIPEDEMLEDLLKKRQYAFASDYIRLWALYNFGGFYLDCDIELVKSLDVLRAYEAFLVEESPGRVTNGACGSIKGNEFFLRCISIMRESFVGKGVVMYSPEVTTEAYASMSSSVSLLKPETFYPYNPYANEIKNFLYKDVTPDTVGIHHWAKTWHIGVVQRIKRILLKR
ncbi:glycosyltransferase family 32 protein [Brachymonas wangyanguii]|uniref:glycosyltransferase family 32 protein n=1 Tax=Brachymonas wangyanguii TaxID=3130163 RepID=UPI00307ED2C0